MERLDLSVVIPVYRNEQSIGELAQRLDEVLRAAGLSFEVIFVEDGSPDDSRRQITAVCAARTGFRGLFLSRNFGQHTAITAGLSHASGRWTVVMDCDLQDDPADIPRMLAAATRARADIVFTRKQAVRHPIFKRATSLLFGGIFNWLSAQPGDRVVIHEARVGNYSLISAKVREAFLSLGDSRRHYLMILRWLGFRREYVDVEHSARKHGKSSYTLGKLLRHALDGIVSQSERLLYVSVVVGFIFFVAAFSAATFLVVNYFVSGYKEGWTSTIVLVLLSTGLILMSLGVLGIYIGRIYEQTKGRPLFVVDEILGGAKGHSQSAASRTDHPPG